MDNLAGISMESLAVTTEPVAVGRRRAVRPDPQRIVDARVRLTRQGKTVIEWARENGHQVELVHKVLSGRRACTSGESHKIAVALGIKDGTA